MDRLLAVLRDEGLPMTAQQIAGKAGRLPCWCQDPARYRTPDPISLAIRTRERADHATDAWGWCVDGTRPVWYHDVYPRLRRLAKVGRVESVRMPDGGVYWCLTVDTGG